MRLGKQQVLGRVLGSVFLGMTVISGTAHALGKKPKTPPESVEQACSRARVEGFKEWKAGDLKSFAFPPKHSQRLPIVFHVVNHQGKGFLASLPITNRELKTHLETLNDVLSPCGIDPELVGLRYWQAPGFLNVPMRSRVNPQFLGETERCLLQPTFVPGAVNVYFVQGVADPLQGNGRSHAYPSYWLQAEQPDDRRFVGAVFVTDLDRSGMADRSGNVRRTVVAHEVGHIFLDTGHVYSNGYNLMADSAQLLAPFLTREQCTEARMSPFVQLRQR